MMDFRLIPPILYFNKYHNKEVWKIPCKIVSIGRPLDDWFSTVEIVRLDFNNLNYVKDIGRIRNTAIKLFKELQMNLPYNNYCLILPSQNENFEIEIYTIDSPLLFTNFEDYEKTKIKSQFQKD